MFAHLKAVLQPPRLTGSMAGGTIAPLTSQETHLGHTHEQKTTGEIKTGGGRFPAGWRLEAAGIVGLLAMVGYFLAISWRKWADPIVDSGPQLYAIWRVSSGAQLYHDFLWNYGPLSVCFNAALFKVFGPGLMVLAAANLVFYAAIVCMAYVVFRKAWGKLGAFAALAVFISVFSFSHLLGVGNYNFVMPYAAEATHGTALILATALLVGAYCEFSRGKAFLLGLCGGIATVMKPEFMLATGVLGIAAIILRQLQNKPVRVEEFGWMGLGLVLPTLAFAAWFARIEPLQQAFIDASQAWWLVLVAGIHNGDVQQKAFMGLNSPWANAWTEGIYSCGAAVVLAAIWAAGWVVNRSWSLIVRTIVAMAALAFAAFAMLKPPVFSRWSEGWMSVGRCLPGLAAIVFVLIVFRIWNERRNEGRIKETTVMSFLLVLQAGAMLARMPLNARVFHLGFFQADFAAMVVAAVMVSELPRWVGEGMWGRGFTVGGCLAVLALCCGAIAEKSYYIRSRQNEPIAEGRDHFYSTTRMDDGTGALVNWSVWQLRSAPPDARVLVLPEGAMINYLSRHKAPEPGWLRGQEQEFATRLEKSPPEYVVLISREMKEFGITRFGAPGNPGEFVIPWVAANYIAQAHVGGDPLDPNAQVGAVIMRLNHSSTNAAGK